MSIESKIVSAEGNPYGAKVTKRGQVITAPLEFSELYPETLASNNVPYTVISPKTGSQFVITDILLYANKSVGTNDATIEVYESNASGSTNIQKLLFTTELPKKINLPLTGLNIITSQGAWINAKTDDNTVYITIGGYYVEAE